MTTKSKCFVSLILLGLVDTVIPFPIIGAILIYVLLQRPPWFKNVIVNIYDPLGLDQNQ
jgi:1-acyl-sn-glycerol-3-phosphate acyltransferase